MQVAFPSLSQRSRRGAAAYLALVVAAACGAFLYALSRNTILACPGDGYGDDWYLATCAGRTYGDYEEGGLYFGLEPAAVAAVRQAEVLLLGNSRAQFGFSTESIMAGFSAIGLRPYLLGFGNTESMGFPRALMAKLALRPKAVVINIDGFFEQRMSPPALSILHGRSALANYQYKQRLQDFHALLCARLPGVCGRHSAIYRSRSTGAWDVSRVRMENAAPVTYAARAVRAQAVDQMVADGRRFLDELGLPAACVVLTVVPTVDTDPELFRTVAERLGHELVMPRQEGLQTLDGSHLDRASAERWSAAFMAAAAPRLQGCR